MNKAKLRITLTLLALILVILACGAPAGTSTESPATDTSSTEVTTDPANGSTTEVPPANATSIQHQTVPVGLPAERSSHAGDYDSSTTAANKTSAGGDRFTFERFERPFNANTMDVYFPELDIVDTFVFEDDTWIFGTITLKGRDANNALSGKYALELDIAQPGNTVDGKSDWLIIVNNPSSTDWTVSGVEVYQDTNDDIGLELAMITDEKASTVSDGYETLIFNQGEGNDPDSAWARISAADPNTIEIAVKRSILGNSDKYLISTWAGHSLIDPALFDLSDHFTHEQAGAGDRALEFFYPAKEVAEVDNSCRMAVGFKPRGDEAGLCPSLAPEVVPGSTPGACVSTPTQVLACSLNPDPSYSCKWVSSSCKCQCDYIGPK